MTSCKAVCSCDYEYSSSLTCSISNSDMKQRQILRIKVIDSIVQLHTVLTTDTQSVTDLIGYINEVSQSPQELNFHSSQKLLNLIQSIASSLNQLTVSSSTVLLAINIFDSILSSNIHNSNSSDDGSKLLDSISVLIKNYGNILTNDMLPGQKSYDGIYGQFRMTNNILSASNSLPSASNRNLTVKLPVSHQEEFNNVSTHNIIIPMDSSSDNQNVQLSAYSIHSSIYNNTKFTSNPLTVHFSQPPCQSENCPVWLVLPFIRQATIVSTNHSKENFKHKCRVGTFNSKSFDCSSGHNLTLTCNGTFNGVLSQQCPVINHYHQCSVLQNSKLVSLSGCTIESVNDVNITCHCLLSGQAIGRRLDSNSTSGSEYSISYVSILSSSVDEFTSTITDYSILETITTPKGLKVLLTILILCLIAVIAFFLAKRSDHMEKTKLNQIADEKKQSTTAGVITRRKANRKEVKWSSKGNHQGNEVTLNRLFNDSLPVIFNTSNQLSEKVVHELKRHHKWFAIVYFHSDNFPRSLRLLSILTNIVIMLFVQSLSYNITSPDDHSCDAYTTKISCTTPRSDFATGTSKCSWRYDSPSQTTGVCTFIQPNGDLFVILFVALFSAIISTPFAVIVDWIVINILAADTNTPESLQLNKVDRDRLDQSFTYDYDLIDKRSEKDFNDLVQNINRFRDTLQQSERIVFDGN